MAFGLDLYSKVVQFTRHLPVRHADPSRRVELHAVRHNPTCTLHIGPSMTSPLRLRIFLGALFFLLACTVSTWANAQIATPKELVTTDQVRAELMAYAPQGVESGKTVWVGLQLTHQPEWHTYWKNSGDSGLPTVLEWTLPAGVLAGDIAWPLPKKLALGKLINYGYDGTVLLPVPLTISPDFKPSLLNSDLTVKLKASWLVCRLECIPQEGEFALRIPVRGSTALNAAGKSVV